MRLALVLALVSDVDLGVTATVLGQRGKKVRLLTGSICKFRVDFCGGRTRNAFYAVLQQFDEFLIVIILFLPVTTRY